MKIIDPFKIRYEDIPLVAFVDNSNNFFSWAIKWRTKGIYCHVMNLMNPFSLLSQELSGLKLIPIDKYLKRNIKIKFWKIKFDAKIKDLILKEMIKDSKLPKYKTMYDFLGIFGQALGLKKINNPFKMFCSERNAKYLRIGDPDFPYHLSPEEQNEYMKTKPELYEVYGYWIAE
jgi:hypothetical protein